MIVTADSSGKLKHYLNAVFIAVLFCSSFAAARTAMPQVAEGDTFPVPFRIGERLTYNVSFGRFSNIAYGEIFVASRGRLADKDAVELRAKFKTLDLGSAIYLVDESRITFAASDTGLPLYTARTQNLGGLPRETINNYLTAPTPNLDLLTLIYKIRASNGVGAATLVENDKTYGVTFQSGQAERVKTDAGEFDSTVVNVQSEYFTDLGIRDVRLNLSTDEARIPVLVRFRTSKGEFRASLASSQIVESEPEPQPTPVPVATPRQTPTPRPVPTATPYIDNQPLAPELAFELGETLNYRVSAGGRVIGSFMLQAKERRQFQGADSLLLSAIATDAVAGYSIFAVGDYVRAQVDPETLAPQQIEIKLTGPLSVHNKTVKFEQKGSVITFDGAGRVEAPVGTQSILSLLYAIRSFNLKPSRDTSNPVNDTRVAVFWESQPYIFTLRPSEAEVITIGEEKIASQMISISATNPQLNQLGIRIWLSNDGRRLPLRISAGAYQADLVSINNVPVK